MQYATLRTIHGVLALGLAALLALYVATGWMIIHRVGGGAPALATAEVAAAAVGGAAEDADRVRAVAREAAAAAGLTGARAAAPEFSGGAWRVKLTRVARSAEVTLVPGEARARVALRSASFGEGIKRLHRVNADGASGGRLAWVIGIDVLSVALLAFALTGLLLFRASKRDRRLGWLLLGAGALYTLGGIAWLAASP